MTIVVVADVISVWFRSGDQMAKRKKSKYTKQFIETWKCRDKECDFQWSYRTLRCPMCSITGAIKIV